MADPIVKIDILLCETLLEVALLREEDFPTDPTVIKDLLLEVPEVPEKDPLVEIADPPLLLLGDLLLPPVLSSVLIHKNLLLKHVPAILVVNLVIWPRIAMYILVTM